MEATLVEGYIFKDVIKSIKELVTDVNLKITPKGIEMQCMDSSRVALVQFFLKAEGFDHFKAKEDFISIGLNIPSLVKILECAKNDNALYIRLKDKNLIEFIFESPKQNQISNFTLKLMEIQCDELEIPDVQYDAIVKMSSKEFQGLIYNFLTIGDTVNMTIKDENLQFSVNGDSSSCVILCKSDGKNIFVTRNIEKEISLTFSLKYLNLFTKASGLSDVVILHISEDQPLRVQYNISDSKNKSFGSVNFYLAPKLEDIANDIFIETDKEPYDEHKEKKEERKE